MDSLDRFSKTTQIPNFMKIRQLEAELFHADRQMDGRKDMTKLIVAVRNIADTVKNYEGDIHLPVLHKLTVAQSGINKPELFVTKQCSFLFSQRPATGFDIEPLYLQYEPRTFPFSQHVFPIRMVERKGAHRDNEETRRKETN
jgi:hypothetical protein